MTAPPDETPTTIGPFPVIRPLASGGMASVFEVEDPADGRRVALKLLTQRGLARPRFDREYRALTRLDHPNIVRVYQFGITDDGQRYLTMEVVEGEAAQVHAKALGRPGTPARTARVLGIVREVALALAYLHERGLVHRDLKSSNVMVLEDGGVKLLDFGTARLVDDEDPITRHGEFVGTFAYASPEQLRGEPVDARADLYALGVLFYRLLTGKRPFEGDNPAALAQLHLEHVPPSPDELVAGVPAAAAAIVMRLLEKEAVARPATASLVADALDRLLGEAGVEPAGPLDLCVPELVGRESEVERIRAFLDAPVPGRLILFQGPLGTGRERVLGQVEADARKRRIATFRAVFPGGGGVGGLSGMARELARGLPRAPGQLSDPDLSCLVRAVGPRAEDQREALVRAFVSLVRRRVESRGRGLVLLLRDLHRAPPLALAVLAGVREAAVAGVLPVTLAATALDEEALPGSLIAGAETVPLGALQPVAIGRLVGAVLGRRAPPPTLSARIHRATGGLPGDAVAVLHAMVQEGLVVARREGPARVVWRDRSGGRLAVPASIRDRLGVRIDGLGRPLRRILEAAAVASMPLSERALAAAVESTAEQTAADLRALASTGLLVSVEGGWVPATGLIAQLVGERVGAARRRLYQRNLAEVVADERPDAGLLRLLVGAGRLSEAARIAVDWAPHALAEHRAVELAPILGRLHRAIETDPPATLDPALRVSLALLAVRVAAMVRPVGADEISALTALPAPDPSRSAVDLAEARLRRAAGDLAGAGAALGRARSRLRRHPDPSTAMAVDLEQGRARSLGGDPGGAVLAFQAAARAAEQLGSARAAEAARIGLGLARFALGELEAAESDLGTVRERAGVREGAAAALHAGVHLAEVLRVCGRHSEALRVLDAGLDQARVADRPFLHAAALHARAAISLDLFRLGEVRDLLSEVEGIELASVHPWLRSEGARLRGRLHLGEGRPDQAVAVLQPASDAMGSVGLPLMEARLLAWLGAARAAAGEEGADAAHERASWLFARHRHMPLHAEACARRALAGAGPVAFAPVDGWLDRVPARLGRLERAVSGLPDPGVEVDPAALQRLEDAEGALAELSAPLSAREASALQVHPWCVRIQRVAGGLRGRGQT